MSKVLKRLILIVIVIVGAMFALPKSEQAATLQSFEISDGTIVYGVTPDRTSEFSGVTKTLGELKNGNYLYVVDPYVVNNNFVFCIEANQGLTNGEFKIDSTITINNDSSNFLKGLAYILANASTGFNSSSQYAYITDTVQIAVWTYLYEHSSEAESALGILGSSNAPGKYERTTTSDNLVKVADEIYNGTKDVRVSGTIHKMINVDKDSYDQKLLIVKSIIIEEHEGFDLTLNKVDSKTGKQISGAEFEVKMSGVKSVEGKNILTGNEVTFKPQIGEVTYKNIKPADNNGTVVITVKETKAPDGYKLDQKEYKMEFTYNSSTGEWRYSSGNIGDRGDDWITSSGGNTFKGEFKLNVKNEPDSPDDLIIMFNKVDDKGELIKKGKATFKVTASLNVEGLKPSYDTIDGVATISGISLTEDTGAIEFEEIAAPDGYTKLSTKFKIFIYKFNGKYEFTKQVGTGITTKYLPITAGTELIVGVSAEAIQGGTLTLNVKNEPETPENPDDLIIKINKVDDNGNFITSDSATFTVNFSSNLKGLINSYPTENGVATIRGISLENPNYYGIIEFKESIAPNGYKPLFTTFKVAICKTNNGYEIRKIDSYGRPTIEVGVDEEIATGVTIKEIGSKTLTLNVINEESSALRLELYKKLATDYEVKKGDGLKIWYKVQGADNNNIKSKNSESGEMEKVRSSGEVEVGSPFILEMEPDNRNNPITITIKETKAPLGYKEHKTEYTLTCTYIGEGKGWRVKKTTSDGNEDLLECHDGNIGNFLRVALTNIPTDGDRKPISTEGNITGQVWVKEQKDDKDIKVHESTSSKYEENDELLGGVDVILDELIIADFKPVYAWRCMYRHDNGKEKVNPPENGNPAYPSWEAKWSEKTLKYIEIPEGWDPDAYWAYYVKNNTGREKKEGYYDVALDEYSDPIKVPIRYEPTDPIKLENVSIGPTNKKGEYNYSFNLTTYKWEYNGVEHQISQYIKSGQVSFKYNGVTYITTSNEQPCQTFTGKYSIGSYYSNATEVRRKEFNDQFRTVNLNNDIATNAYGIFRKEQGLVGKSKIEIPVNGNKNGNTAYQMSATSFWGQVGYPTDDPETKRPITITANMGLLTREVDVSASTQVESAKMTINGKETTYSYNDILEGKLTNTDLNELNSGNSGETIPVDVYPTDYYYRIKDYKAGALNGNNEYVGGAIEEKNTDELELEVYVTYKVRLFAATAGKKVGINQIAYYYDQNYDLVSIQGGTQAPLDKNLSQIDGMAGIMVNGSWDVSAGEQYVYFTFRVKEHNDLMYTGNINGHIVTITSYSTDEGLLDIDSAIRNIRNDGKDTNKIMGLDEVQFEDDTAIAEKIEIVITKETRKISGNVFDDANKNGILDDTNINDVIVQLIEITKSGNEYIWQETKVGSGTVTTLVADRQNNHVNGTEFEGMRDYKNDVTGVGQYEFSDIVPGNYIVRFIYGDCYSDNYEITTNNTKYNGVDFKSTKDPNYKVEWYNNAIENYAENASVARDNEARRLEVIATTTEIDAGLGVALDVYAKNKSLNDLTDAERENIVSYIKNLGQDNELYVAISKVFNTVNMNEISSIVEKISIDELKNNTKYLEALKKCISYKTFMAAETSKINVPVDDTTLKDETGTKREVTGASKTNGYKFNKININFQNVNFGVMKKPEVKLELEKHITGLKITVNGTGTAPIVDASITNLVDIINESATQPKVTGVTTGLATDKSTRGNRGFWELQTDTEELKNGANLEVEYTYVVKNIGEEDYISSALADLYENNQSGYSNNLKKTVSELKPAIKGKTHTYGNILGQYYYTGVKANTDRAVTTRAEEIAEALNNQLRYEESKTNSYVNEYFIRNSTIEERYKNIYDVEGNLIQEDKRDTVIITKAPNSFLARNTMDTSKKVKLETVLSSLDLDSKGNIPSYIAEITRYSSASGGRDLSSIPGNLNYVHSKDTRITVEDNNEKDEFWGETIMISKKTGENKVLALQIGITVAISVAVIGVGLVLIRKFVLVK